MSYILLWVVFNPIYLGDYNSLAACEAARDAVAVAAKDGAAAAASAGAALAKIPKPDTSPEAIAKSMLCVKKG